MKILAVSLLRLGDIFMHQQILRDLRGQYPEAQIDIVINSQFAMTEGLLHEADQVHLFPRESLQRELVEASGSFFRGFLALQTWVRRLNYENYDMVFDLTHTFLSHKLVDLLQARVKKTSTQGYFNDIFSVSHSTGFGYIEALRNSLGVMKTQGPPRIDSVAERGKKQISIQPLTSDTKKNWGLFVYRRLIEILAIELPEYEFVILGAPFEEQALRRSFVESERVRIAILTLSDLRSHLSETGLLVSGDTATIHMAAQTRTPLVGIYLGSADPYKTAPWVEGAIVFQAVEACAPCSHSGQCSQISQLCAENLSPESVGQALVLLVKSGLEGLKFEAGSFSFSIFQQARTVGGGLALENLASLEESVRVVTGQMAWERVFDTSNSISDVGAIDFLVNQFREQSVDLAVHTKEELGLLRDQRRLIIELEAWMRDVSKNLLRNESQFDFANTDVLPLKNLIQEWSRISGEDEVKSLLENLKSDFDRENLFSFYKKARWTLGLVSQFLNYKMQIYEDLKMKLKERGYNYVSGPGKLS